MTIEQYIIKTRKVYIADLNRSIKVLKEAEEANSQDHLMAIMHLQTQLNEYTLELKNAKKHRTKV